MAYEPTYRDIEIVKYPFHTEESYRRGRKRDELLKQMPELIDKLIRKIIALEAMSGILDELTPEQLEAFEVAVKRRPLFK